MNASNPAIEERLGYVIVEGRRYETWVRSEPDDEGTWHNAILYVPEGGRRTSPARVSGVPWHVPPGIALERAHGLAEADLAALFRRARKPPPPVA